MDKVKFSVLSSCISRDVLDFNTEANCFGSDKYIVERCVQLISNYTILTGYSFNVNPTVFDSINNISNFKKRCIQLDLNKTSIKYLSEVHSDYFLYDFANEHKPVYKSNDEHILFTRSYAADVCISIIKQLSGCKNINSYEFYMLSEDELVKRTNVVFDKISSMYHPEEIILNCVRAADSYVAKNGAKYFFLKNSVDKYANKLNTLIAKLESLFEQKFKGCHIIPALPNVVADEKHRWGLMPLHFHNLYYEYAEKCIDIITQKLERSEEEQQIEFLRQLYSEKFATLRAKAEQKSIALDRDKWKNYATSFKSIINNGLIDYDSNAQKNIVKALLSKGYKHIAIYGDSEITKVLCNVLGGGTDISIDYIVENSSKPVPGIKTVDRNLANYPDCDVMLVADVYGYSGIKDKLEKLKVPFPFFNAAEFIQSLPAGDDSGVQKIKDKISELSAQLEAKSKNEEVLSNKVADLTEENASLTAKADDLTAQLEAKTASEAALTSRVDTLTNENVSLVDITKNLTTQLNASTQNVAKLSEKVSALTQKDAESAAKIAELTKNEERLSTENNSLREAGNEASAQLASIQSSTSFKLGRAITYIPRKLRDAFKKK